MLAAVLALSMSDGYQLVFSDEFNVDGRPDPKKWRYELGFVRNRELQWYQRSNASISNGSLVIEGRRERVVNPQYEAGSQDWRKNREYAEYTSACIKTYGIKSWTYGRWEIRARIDARPGLWPAIWTVGDRGPWPQSGEIDLLEFYSDSILANTVHGTGGGVWNTGKFPYSKFTEKDKDWGSKFHTWKMDWTKDHIRLYLDDELLNESKLSKAVNPDGRQPFQEPHHLLLNLAIGSNAGDPSKTTFPGKFEVDYVRIYQQK